MVLLGDVLAVVAFLFGACASIWALLVVSSTLFSRRVALSAEAIERSPWIVFFLGLILFLFGGALIIALIASKFPFFMLAGYSLLVMVLIFSVLGASGLVQLIAKRIKALDPDLSPFLVLSRAALMVSAVSLVPFLGWFLVLPVLLIVGLGGGTLCLFRRPAAPPVMPAQQEL